MQFAYIGLCSYIVYTMFLWVQKHARTSQFCRLINLEIKFCICKFKSAVSNIIVPIHIHNTTFWILPWNKENIWILFLGWLLSKIWKHSQTHDLKTDKEHVKHSWHMACIGTYANVYYILIYILEKNIQKIFVMRTLLSFDTFQKNLENIILSSIKERKTM